MCVGGGEEGGCGRGGAGVLQEVHRESLKEFEKGRQQEAGILAASCHHP